VRRFGILRPARRRVAIAALIVVAIGLAATVAAQRRGFGRFAFRLPPNPPYDGAFQYCRAMRQRHPQGDGGDWTTDYPQADQNLPYRFSELTKAPVSRDPRGGYNHAIVSLGDDDLYRCGIIIMQEVGSLYLDSEDAAHLHDYLVKGGFLWVDDFWGEYAWRIWESEIRKALPAGEFPMVDIPLGHPIFHMLYDVKGVAQIPAIGVWEGSGQTSERADSQVPHARIILDPQGHVLVLITHNTDYSDAFEREGESRAYFERFAGLGYAFGINALLYAMTH
jgi:Domain of unknown function (DUF4159)